MTEVVKIAPSLLAADFRRLESEVAKVASADMLHLDIMDGVFVPNISFGPGVVASLRPVTKLFFDVHLMVQAPEKYLKTFKDAGADGITIHSESTPHVHRCVSMIREMGLRAGLSLNPATPVEAVEPMLDELDMILVMTVDPGFGGQSFIPSMLRKISRVSGLAKNSNNDILIQVDGGINFETAPEAINAGADVLVAGVAVFRSENPKAAIEGLRH